MLNDPLVRAFEDHTLDPVKFRHREHLYVAWCYLKSLPLEEALARYVRNLQSLTRALGVPQKYHATITWAFVILVHEAMQDPELEGSGFGALLARHPSLLDQKTLGAYYDKTEIDSPTARARFVLPRRNDGGVSARDSG